MQGFCHLISTESEYLVSVHACTGLSWSLQLFESNKKPNLLVLFRISNPPLMVYFQNFITHAHLRDTVCHLLLLSCLLIWFTYSGTARSAAMWSSKHT